MLNGIVRFSIRFRGIVIALACALLGYGIFSLLRSSYDAFPDFAPPQVSVQTEAPGLSPEQVEVLVYLYHYNQYQAYDMLFWYCHRDNYNSIKIFC